MRDYKLLLIGFWFAATLTHAQTNYPYAVRTLAGTGALGDGGPAAASLLEFPQSVAVDASGRVYIGDSGNGRIRVVKPDGSIDTLAYGSAYSMKLDSAGNIYYSDGLYRIFKINSHGQTTLLAGAAPGFGGDGGLAINAKLYFPMGLAVDSLGNVYFADYLNLRIREITTDGKIQTVAGTGALAYGRENVQAYSSPLAYPTAVEVDGAGNLYIAELNRIRKVSTSGTITTIAGYGDDPHQRTGDQQRDRFHLGVCHRQEQQPLSRRRGL